MAKVHDEFTAPAYEIWIEGKRLDPLSIGQFITNVEYESADGMADVGSFTVLNPDMQFNNRKIFAPGNHMDIYMGYRGDAALTYVGGVQIVEPDYDFPSNGMPTLRVKGYSKDHLMMDNAPAELKNKSGKNKTTNESPRDMNKERTLNDVLVAKALSYGMVPVIKLDTSNPIVTKKRRFLQKPGVTDYQFIRGWANFTNHLFWVEYNPVAKQWSMNFVSGDRLGPGTGKLVTYNQLDTAEVFRYEKDGTGNLQSFRPKMFIRNRKTDLKVAYISNDGRVFGVEQEFFDEASAVDIKYKGEKEDNASLEDIDGGRVKIEFNDASVEIVTGRRFRDLEELKQWAAEWFDKRNKELIWSEGTLVGVPQLAARQQHWISGFGRTFDGYYSFTRVRHSLAPDKGYMTSFSAKKVILSKSTLNPIVPTGVVA